MARGPTERRRGQVCPVGLRHSKSTHTRTCYPKWSRRPFCPWRDPSGSEPGSRALLAVCSLATGLLDHPSQGRQGPHGAPAWATGTSALTSHHLFLPLVPSLGLDPSCALPAPCPMSLEALVQFVMIRSLSFSLSEVTICTILSLKSSVFLFVSVIRQGCTSGSPTWACEVGMHFTATNSGDQRHHLKPHGKEVKDGVLTLNPGFTPSRLCDLKQVS